MGRKILHVTVRTIDEKNHVRTYNKDQIELDSIKFKEDKPKKKDDKKDKKN